MKHWLRVGRALLSSGLRRPAGHDFDSGGVRLHYSDEGSGAQTVVLIHGFAVNSWLNWGWVGVASALAQTMRVVSLDMRGHGRSGKPHRTTAYGAAMLKDVVELLDHLGLARAHVVGYSLGGFVALKLAACHPERLLSAGVLGAGWERLDNPSFRAALPRVAEALRAGRGTGPLMAHLGDRRQQHGRMHDVWVKLLTRYANDQLALACLVQTLPELALTELELRAIEVPVLSIVGERDPLIHSMRNMQGKIAQHSVHVLPDADHLQAPLDPALREHLEAFLCEHARTTL